MKPNEIGFSVNMFVFVRVKDHSKGDEFRLYWFIETKNMSRRLTFSMELLCLDGFICVA